MVQDVENGLSSFVLGQTAEILLVGKRMRRLALFLSLFLWSGLAQAQTVSARDYDAYWLWAGVNARPELKQAKTVYLLQGQVGETGRLPNRTVRLIAQGGAVAKITNQDIWLVYRAHNLRWTPAVYSQILARLKRWEQTGSAIKGIQIDFDSATKHLDQYASFLRDLRNRLPSQYQLGITGLLDWSSQGDSVALASLGDVVDEVILQTYQGRHTIKGYQDYLAHLDRVRIPFKIGLVENGAWDPPASISANPNFHGYVVFLLNPDIESLSRQKSIEGR
jgi:Protein of unknown function (DUF3142)